jgi:peptidoglycan/xylan/chitin deacetylase (PgdA/CDA1 family)
LPEPRARQEIEASSARIEAMTGIRPRHFAYPYGSADTAGKREFALARDAGFATAVTTRRGVLDSGHANHLAELPRISVNGDYQRLRYLDLLLSGVPYAIERRINRLRGRSAASASI